ncbi:phage tail protein, partial [Clostridium botulinum]
KIQTLKNTFATNLTAKEQPSTGNETLLNLINKVANINVGKKYAKGELTEVEFTENYIISYLDFKPSIILISGWENRSPNYVDFTINMIYTSDGFICGGQHTYDQLKGSTLLVRAGASSGNNFQFSTNFTDDITATNNGFVIKQSSFLQYIHSNFKWVAVE